MNARQPPGTALVTGASSGIGRALALCFARDRWRLVLVARNQEALRAVATEAQRLSGATADILVADLARPDGPEKIARAMEREGMAIDALVNNAGFGGNGAFADTRLDEELAMLQVNVAAVTHLTKLFLPGMLARRRGRVLNVASTAGFQPGPFMAVYYASKAYVIMFSEALAEELRGTGVTVTALCPGATATGFAERAGATRSRLFSGAFSRLSAAPAVARAGYRGMLRGKALVVPGLTNKLALQSLRVSPRSAVRRLVRRMNTPRV